MSRFSPKLYTLGETSISSRAICRHPATAAVINFKECPPSIEAFQLHEPESKHHTDSSMRPLEVEEPKRRRAEEAKSRRGEEPKRPCDESFSLGYAAAGSPGS